MPLEVEVKVALGGTEQEADAELRAAGAVRRRGPELQDDRLFDTPGGDLLGQGRVLRLRRRGDGGAVLTWKGPPDAGGDLKVRQEWETSVENPEAMTRILAGLGLRPTVRYQKVRSRYDLEGVELCLDRTPAGLFLELEGAAEAIRAVAARLGFEPDQFDRRDYLQIWTDRGGRGDMIFREES